MSFINSNDQENIIVLKDKAGNEFEFEYLETIGFEGKEYIVLLPLDEVAEGEEGQVVILEYLEEEGEINFLPVEDDDTLQEIFEMFKAAVARKYEIN